MSTGIQPHDEKPAGVWNSGGARYDRISRGIADGIEHRVLRLDPRPGERVLDLAAGTGWTSRLVARRGAQVIGADISADLPAFAAERAKAEGLDVEYRVADAEDLPFADGEFDAVISTCGVMFASRPEAAAAELGRVCRKGGRIALTTWLSDGNLSNPYQPDKPGSGTVTLQSSRACLPCQHARYLRCRHRPPRGAGMQCAFNPAARSAQTRSRRCSRRCRGRRGCPGARAGRPRR